MPGGAFPGILYGLESVQRDAYERTRLDQIKRELDAADFKQKQKEQQAEQQRRYQAEALSKIDAMRVTPRPSTSTAGDQPTGQPPMPGQASQPMQRAFGPQAGLGAAMLGGASPQTPQGWSPSRAAPPELGGMPASGAGVPYESPKVTPRPSGVDTVAPENLYRSPADLLSQLTKEGRTPDEIYGIMQEAVPILDKFNKDVMDQVRLKKEIYDAQKSAADAVTAKFKSEHPEEKKETDIEGFIDRMAEKGIITKESVGALKLEALEGSLAKMRPSEGGVPGGVGSDLLVDKGTGKSYAINKRSGKAWEMGEDGKWSEINPNELAKKELSKPGVSAKGGTQAQAVRQKLVQAGAQNSLARLDEIDKKYGNATTSSFFGQSAEGPVTRYAYGKGRALGLSDKDRQVDAAWASFIDEAIPVFTGGLRGSDAFRRFLIEQAPGPGDDPKTVQEKKRLLRANINGTLHTFFDRFASDPSMWAQGTKQEEIDEAKASVSGGGEKAKGGAGVWTVEPVK
jgi:hypothetical protein